MDVPDISIKLTPPKYINDVVLEFCYCIDSTSLPQYIKCYNFKSSKAGRCFDNVRQYISEFGGKKIVGWNIWVFKNVFIHAESHAIIEDLNGELFDVSPQDSDKTLFLKDSGLQHLDNPIKSKYQVLTSSKISKEFVKLREEIDEEIFSNKKGFYLSQQEAYLYNMFMQKFSEVRSSNEFCSCESGLRYKKCCGK